MRRVKFRVVCVGRPRDRELGAVIAAYETRAARYWPLDFTEVREESGRDDAGVVRQREGQRLLEASAGAVLVAVDERGMTMTSTAFASWMQRLREEARDVAMAVGGANGLDEPVRQRASYLLALAPWTLPHELARLVLAEQLYRAGTIVRREPYHKQGDRSA